MYEKGSVSGASGVVKPVAGLELLGVGSIIGMVPVIAWVNERFARSLVMFVASFLGRGPREVKKCSASSLFGISGVSVSSMSVSIAPVTDSQSGSQFSVSQSSVPS